MSQPRPFVSLLIGIGDPRESSEQPRRGPHEKAAAGDAWVFLQLSRLARQLGHERAASVFEEQARAVLELGGRRERLA
jgi:hypothetical protein